MNASWLCGITSVLVATENSFCLRDGSTTSLFAILRKGIQEFPIAPSVVNKLVSATQLAGGDGVLVPITAAAWALRTDSNQD
jgi:hypothetical protein